MTHNSVHLKAWRTAVGWAMRAALGTEPPTEGEVWMKLHFVVQPRRQGDAPDLDKLVRAVLDALTGIAYLDDKQVVAINARRTLLGPDALASDREGVTIELEPR
jgi:crossover junction endodeoxyribonuclease RusA